MSLPALLLTAGWIVLVVLILMLFGRTAGGAWSIAGSVARGVREWAGSRPVDRRPAPVPRGAPGPVAELEDFGGRPTG